MNNSKGLSEDKGQVDVASGGKNKGLWLQRKYLRRQLVLKRGHRCLRIAVERS